MTISQNTHLSYLNYLLTKAATYGIPLEKKEKNNVFALRDIINNHELEQNELAKRTAEISLSEINANWEQESISRAQAVFHRMHQRVQSNPKLSDWQLEILEKANKYHLSYDRDDIDWFKLSDTIDEIEPLIKEAERYGIYDWNANDPVDIRQRIEEAEHKAYREHKQLCNDYIASRL